MEGKADTADELNLAAVIPQSKATIRSASLHKTVYFILC